MRAPDRLNRVVLGVLGIAAATVGAYGLAR